MAVHRAHQHGERVQQHKNGREQSHAGERGCADALNVPDVNAVYDVVQQVHHLRHHGRDHQLQHQLFHAAGPHVLFCLCHGTKTPFASNLNYIPYIILENRKKASPFLQKPLHLAKNTNKKARPALQTGPGIGEKSVDGRRLFCYTI